ncbi:MAG: FGGY-family carbohydrate kinase [Lachnospiraceae bacterium]|nr:FGGY-family carbohydrate kinase [Lachnospiraceae bacterium]
MDAKQAILEGKTALGIEFGSTRIKAVLTDEDFKPIANGAHSWENRLENGVWTYSLDDIWNGLQDCYAKLAADVKEKYGTELTTVGSIGFSAMMHGYMVFDDKDELMVPFRTWRNTITGEASEKLTKLLKFHIPQRWSVAHLYQSILEGMDHVKDIKYLSTLAGYVHWKLTGVKAVGIGEASGMFPIDPETLDYDEGMIKLFDEDIAGKGYPWKLRDILPKVLVAGDSAGTLTEEGAKLLDVSGKLKAGIPLCPAEGDAGTGMTATNAVAARTGNVSAGTSCFAMVVLEKNLNEVYDELDIVTTPTGKPVAMVHCNNCTSDLNAWVSLFDEVIKLAGGSIDMQELYSRLYAKALEGESDGGGVLAYNYLSGEHITHMNEGRPLVTRLPDAKLSLANFMRVTLFTALGALKTGMNILIRKENVRVEKITGHGGWFNAKGSGQQIMAAALGVPVEVMETAGEGGPWGMAILADFMRRKSDGETLEDFLSKKVFADAKGEVMAPVDADVKGFDAFLERYSAGLPIEKAAIDSLK